MRWMLVAVAGLVMSIFEGCKRQGGEDGHLKEVVSHVALNLSTFPNVLPMYAGSGRNHLDGR